MTTIREYQEQTGHSVHSAENQRILEKLCSREIIYNVSPLVYELAQKFDCFDAEYSEDLLDAFRGEPDYEEADPRDTLSGEKETRTGPPPLQIGLRWEG